jgi:hypothetical protein
LGYIDALVKEKQFETLENVLSDGRKMKLTGEKVDVLEAQFNTKTVNQYQK